MLEGPGGDGMCLTGSYPGPGHHLDGNITEIQGNQGQEGLLGV